MSKNIQHLCMLGPSNKWFTLTIDDDDDGDYDDYGGDDDYDKFLCIRLGLHQLLGQVLNLLRCKQNID